MVENVTIERVKSLQWQSIFHMFYIEPVVFMLLFSISLSGTILRNQIIYQTCTTIFHYNASDCKLLDSKNASPEINAIETELQPYVANLFSSRTLLESIVPAFCGLFVGSWSDHYGRKPLLIVSLIGFAASFLVTAAICELSSLYPINPWWYIVAAVPHSLLGGNCVFSVAAICFISDITDTKARPYRMIFMESLFFIGLTIGSLLSSFLYEATSAAFTFGVSGGIVMTTTLYIIFFVPESLHSRLAQDAKRAAKKERDQPLPACDLQLDCVSIDCPPIFIAVELEEKSTPAPPKFDTDILDRYVELPEKPTAAKRTGLFSYHHITEMLNSCLKEREHNARAIIWLATVAMFLSIFVFDGVMTVMYLFVREKFHWTVRDYTFYETVSHLVPMIGTLMGFLILRKVFGLSVVTLAMLAFLSEVLNNLAKGFAVQTWQMYLSVGLGCLRSISGPMCRTIVSNIVPPSDLGKIFSIKNVLQSFAPFVAAPLYTYIYKSWLESYPGLFNFVSAALYFLSFVFIGCVWLIKLKHREYYAKMLK